MWKRSTAEGYTVNHMPTTTFTNAGGSGITSIIRTPLAILVLFIVVMVMAGLSVASAISGDLTAAAVSAAGFFVIILILVAVNAIK